MASTLENRKARNPNRSVRMIGTGELVITMNAHDVTHYALEQIPTGFGTAFSLTKLAVLDGKPVTGETYEVSIGGAAYNGDSCECKGNTRWSHCKHVSALRRLLALGKIGGGK